MSGPSVEPQPDTPGPDEPPLGEKSATVLFGLLHDLYRQEVSAEEDVHRTLPFFATALGLIVASLNYSATQLPSWDQVLATCSSTRPPSLNWPLLGCAWSACLAAAFLIIVVGLSVAVLVFLGLAAKKRTYERIGPEPEIIAGAMEIHAFHSERNSGTDQESLDRIVSANIREQLLIPLAKAASANRAANLQRYHRRSQAISCLLWSLFFALLSIITTVLMAKFGPIGTKS